MTRAVGKPRIRISSSQTAMRVPRKKLQRLIPFVAREEGVRLAEVDLAVVNGEEIASLNRDYLRHVGATDVLSFDLSDVRTAGLCVQLVVCGDLALAQVRARNTGSQRELMLYVVHGLLHQMGYEDTSVRGAARMRAREDELLDTFLKQTRH